MMRIVASTSTAPSAAHARGAQAQVKTTPGRRSMLMAQTAFVLFSRPRAASAASTRAEDAREYARDTLATLDAMEKMMAGEAHDMEAISGWNERNKMRYDAKTQGKSFLLTTKLVSLIKGDDVDEEKFREWLSYARGFTDGSLTGKAARDAYGSAVWGNYDKTDPKNRIGLCVFGETGPTKYLGINCDGY